MVINESHKLQLQRISIPLTPIPASPQIGTDDDDTDFDQESSSLFFDSVYSLSSSSESYKSRQEKSTKQWETVHSPVLKAMVEGCAMPSDCYCLNCDSRAEAYCKDCGSLGMYCISCIKLLHTKVNFTHALFAWKVNGIAVVKKNS